MLTPLEMVMLATLRACTEELREHDAEYKHVTRRVVFDQILDVIAKAEKKRELPVQEEPRWFVKRDDESPSEFKYRTDEIRKHRLAHNDGFHKETPEPNCPACQRIVRLEVYAAEDDVDDALHGRSL